MPASIQAGLASGTSARYAVAGREFEDFLRSFEKLWAESSLKGEPIPWRLQRRCRRLTGGPPTGGYGSVFADLVESGFDGIEGAVFGDRIAASPSFLDEPGGDRFPIPPTIEQVPAVHLFLAGSADPAIGSPLTCDFKNDGGNRSPG